MKRRAGCFVITKHGAVSFNCERAQIAQSVEQGTENPCVGGSIPPLGTTSKKSALGAHFCPLGKKYRIIV